MFSIKRVSQQKLVFQRSVSKTYLAILGSVLTGFNILCKQMRLYQVVVLNVTERYTQKLGKQ